ncbi:MAG: bifunctional pyr operon transcriptional regulator/uracil phosphoribosyltransferase PyrR [Phycisphaerae bacterium]
MAASTDNRKLLQNLPAGAAAGNLKAMQELMAAEDIARCIRQMTEKILAAGELMSDSSLALVGIRRRGEVLAQRIAAGIAAAQKRPVDVGALDITMYRDDVVGNRSIVIPMGTEMNFRLDDRPVLLLDDVLHTGRSVRAALDALVDFGRPRFIRLVVLVDRGGREYPVAADFVGRRVEVPPLSRVRVSLRPIDAVDAVFVDMAGRAAGGDWR